MAITEAKRYRYLCFNSKGYHFLMQSKYSVINRAILKKIEIHLKNIGAFHFFAINLIFSIWIDHPTYEINPLYFYILTPMCR